MKGSQDRSGRGVAGNFAGSGACDGCAEADLTQREVSHGCVGDRSCGEDGFLLMGAIIAIFLVLLVLSVAAPTMARQLRRDRELESVHRGNQYVRAIQLYYRKLGHYPGNMEQLEKSNNIRFLRQRYADPMTGKPDWRLIHLGEQKTTIKGFFGQPLAGIATSGLGTASSMVSPSGTGSSPSVFGAPGGAGTAGGPGSPGGPGLGGAAGGSGAAGTFGSGGANGGLGGGVGTAGAGTGSSDASAGTSPTSAGGISSQSASTFSGSGAPFVGVGGSAPGESIMVLNEQTTYPTWEFVYDPRIEQMKAKVNILGGGMASGSGAGLGSGSGFGSPTPSTLPGSSAPGAGSPPATPANPTTPQ